MATLPTVSAELLQAIAERREWTQRSEVAIALVRNPKTPVTTAVRLLDYVGVPELRRLVKDPGTRGPVRAAAAKKIL
jgi:hypothetical protein